MTQAQALLTGVLSSFIFILINTALNVYMKWLFNKTGGDFAHPWTMLAVQQFQTFFVLYLGLSLVRSYGYNQDDRGKSPLLPECGGASTLLSILAVTVMFCINVGLNSLSLVSISITLNQTIRAFLPVGVLLVATCVEQRVYPKHSYLTTGLLVMGIGLTCYSSPNFQFYGFSLAFVSTLVAAVSTSLNGRLLSKGPFKNTGAYGIVRLTLLQSIPSFFIFALLAFFTEGRSVVEKFRSNSEGRWQWHQHVGLVTISSVLALTCNLSRFLLVSATNALMEALAGNAKVATLCIIDHQCFGTVLHLHNYAGLGLTIVGFSVHLTLQWSIKEEPEGQEKKLNDPVLPVGDQATARSRKLYSPHMLSGAETGLAGEYLAVDIGRDLTRFRGKFRGVDPSGSPNSSTPQIRRHRSVTWPEEAPTSQVSHGFLKDVDLSRALAFPSWLSVEDNGHGVDLYASSPSNASEMMSPLVSSARSRSYSDPTDTKNSMSRMSEDPWQRTLLHAVDEETDEESGETRTPPALGYL